MELNVAARASLAERICEALEVLPGSTAQLRGSLARGSGDQYSDIDVTWRIPDDAWERSIAGLAAMLGRVCAVESLRSDPDFQRSQKHHLIFVRFAGVPLFWRLDLEIFAQSIGEASDYDRDNSHARGDDWSATESALANAVAAVKAHLRQKDGEGRQLLARAYRRVGLGCPPIDERAAILRLVAETAEIDTATAVFGSRIRQLVLAAWPV